MLSEVLCEQNTLDEGIDIESCYVRSNAKSVYHVTSHGIFLGWAPLLGKWQKFAVFERCFSIRNYVDIAISNKIIR